MEGALASVERSLRTVKLTRKSGGGCAQSVPKRANPGSWRNAAKSPGIENFSLHPGHFPPLGDSPHPKPEVHS
jgi:hypothetical protein